MLRGGENLHSTIFKEKILGQPEKKKNKTLNLFFSTGRNRALPPLSSFLKTKQTPPSLGKKPKLTPQLFALHLLLPHSPAILHRHPDTSLSSPVLADLEHPVTTSSSLSIGCSPFARPHSPSLQPS
jgi:hypothetical protein